MNYEAVPDHITDEWRVEAIDYEGEGECYLALFSGPCAKKRAQDYAEWMNAHRDDEPTVSSYIDSYTGEVRIEIGPEEEKIDLVLPLHTAEALRDCLQWTLK